MPTKLPTAEKAPKQGKHPRFAQDIQANKGLKFKKHKSLYQVGLNIKKQSESTGLVKNQPNGTYSVNKLGALGQGLKASVALKPSMLGAVGRKITEPFQKLGDKGNARTGQGLNYKNKPKTKKNKKRKSKRKVQRTYYNYPHSVKNQYPGTKRYDSPVGELYKPDYGSAIKQGIKNTVKDIVKGGSFSPNYIGSKVSSKAGSDFAKSVKNKKHKTKRKIDSSAIYNSLDKARTKYLGIPHIAEDKRSIGQKVKEGYIAKNSNAIKEGFKGAGRDIVKGGYSLLAGSKRASALEGGAITGGKGSFGKSKYKKRKVMCKKNHSHNKMC